ncbi:amidase signature enzyme [Ophiobolus disseminans]|uniref:Amidase signature enzyme n=1 Tax=Ophiobolus disseminans TaxID=1469910 RepID=A0A6A7AKD2_9PLEO|nr:amidase signature enzyme [Ophiobolus disseminans]
MPTTAPQLRHATLPELIHGLQNGQFTGEHLTWSAVSVVLADHFTASRSSSRTTYLRSTAWTPHVARSLALVGARPPEEADVVTAPRKAGSVIIGKANMAEWAGFRSTSGCSGWSARGGQTKGIFYPGMKASGSSGGCAVAVALGLCFAAIGTEKCYFTVSPAERSDVVGFKPTRGLISSEGLIFASKRLDTVGVSTRNVSDAMHMLLELVYHDSHHTLETKLKILQDIGPVCMNRGLAGVRIGIPWHLRDFATLHGAKLEPFKHMLNALRCVGATNVHEVIVTGAEEFEAMSAPEKSIILDTDMKSGINTYLSSLTTNPHYIRDVQDLIAFTKECPSEAYPFRNVEGFERAEATAPDSELYLRMLGRDEYFAGEGGIDGALNHHRCTILIVPVLSVTLQSFAAKAGSPVMSVPIGSYPTGTVVRRMRRTDWSMLHQEYRTYSIVRFSAYIFGRATKDEDVLKVGYLIERSTRVRKGLKPYLQPKTELGPVV